MNIVISGLANSRYVFFITSIVLLGAMVSCSTESPEKLRLWYEHPAASWNEALPIGNGRIGAMVFGGIHSEQLQLNEATLWSGGPKDWNNPDAKKVLNSIRRDLFGKNYKGATALAKKMQGPYTARYLTLGSLFLNMDQDNNSISHYQRDLNLTDAVASVNYENNGTHFKREYFSSYPDQVLVMRLSADKQGALSFSTRFDNPLHREIEQDDEHTVVMKGKCPAFVAHRDSRDEQIVYNDNEGMRYDVRLRARSKDGTISSDTTGLHIEHATEAVLILSIGTSFNGFDKSPGKNGKDPSVDAKRYLAAASTMSYDDLLKNHKQDYQDLFNRVSLDLGSDAHAKLPTDERLLDYTKAEGNQDPQLTTLLFQYGRYLLIASSRKGAPPANLQGIWNDKIQPPWGSNYTININTEMNYWPAEKDNLSETAVPLFNFISHLADNGAETARVNYGADGWVAHHNSDIWAQTAPTGGYEWDPKGDPRWSMWQMGGAWLTRHLWEHYQFTGDKNFLNEKAYPIMKGACNFMLDWLVVGLHGNLVTAPSTSPENNFRIEGKRIGTVSIASTMDMSIIRDLFNNTIEASEILNVDEDFRQKLQDAYKKLYPFQVGQYGQLQEWYKDWDDPGDHHRHVSHLYGLYPANLISPRRTPKLAAAAKRSLLLRGDGGTGWSKAWKINWWARLEDGDHAYKMLNQQLFIAGSQHNASDDRGGSYLNLLDAHPPFQIDGNFGCTSGITEMLLQSQDGAVYLLPALPAAWPQGKVEGLKTHGGFTVDMQWSDGQLRQATIHSLLGGVCRIRSKSPISTSSIPFSEAVGENPNPFFQVSPDTDIHIKNLDKLPDVSLEKTKEYDIKTSPRESYTIKF